jgi:hypothetical protein
MSKLTWFKFTPSDYMMGKIQRCPEVTQARFMRLCCLYWNKQCELTYEDAEIEIDKEHVDILISKRVVVGQNGIINISFLDEQFADIEDESEGKKTSGIIGNLKRWHREIYEQYQAKKISLEQAVELSKSHREPIADLSHPDSTPIADLSQNIADKNRTDKNRTDKTKTDIPAWEDFLAYALQNKPLVSKSDLKLKYDAWVVNGWKKQSKDGKLVKIANWKGTLLNTLPYIANTPAPQVRRVSL